MEGFEEKWELILKEFRWQHIYVAMKALDWDWCIDKSKNLFGIPTVKTIQESAYRLLSEAWQSKKSIASGGFVATYEDGELILEFVLENIYTGDL